MIAAVVERARGRIKVMAGTGSNNTTEALRLTKFARKKAGARRLIVGPYYNKPSQEGYYRHFATWPRRWTFPSSSTTFRVGPARISCPRRLLDWPG